MNIVVPLFMLVVVVCWFFVATGRVEPTDPRLLAPAVGAMVAGGAFFLYAYVRAGRERAAAMRRAAEGLGWEFAERVPPGEAAGRAQLSNLHGRGCGRGS